MESKLQFDFATNQYVLKKITTIDAFQSRWHVEQTDERLFLKQMKIQSMIESTGSSTRIEGSTLTIPRATIKRDLSILVERRLVVQVGKGRGVRYFVEKTPE